MEVDQQVSGMIDELVGEPLGEQLRKAREQKALTVREAADSLRIMPYQIEALEQQDFSVFKADVFIRSYLRNYAGLLGLDPQAILDQYQQKHFVERVIPIVTRPKSVQLPCKKRYVGVVAVLAVILLLWLINRELPQIDKAAQLQPLVEVEEQILSLGADSETEISSLASEDLVAPTNALIAGDYDTVAVAVDVEPIIAEAVSSAAEHRLELNFSAECWVEIKDAEGKTLIADIKREGDNVVVEGTAPFNVVLGYAPAVVLSYNGETVEINTNTRTQAARLVVGRS
ncbi:RodZ domain-containing protein [Dasania marina]|uniref:RodZ domain-containing protein n=1 Tax=Dasania marina TaxID=471499 RepID=UPI0003697B5E|nr:RodZ domain-containing protein [Dasania marina]